jgi:ribosomal protein S18 acetylase RimI-like enzyme
MAPRDIPEVATLLGSSWRRTYAPLIGVERSAAESDARHMPEKLELELARSHVMAFVAENDRNAISGYAMVDIDDDGQAWLERLHVRPEDFGSGIGALLLNAAIDAVDRKPSLALELIRGNERAQAFYAKHGFVVEGQQDACGSMNGVPTLIMRLRLPPA